jgi:cytochrome b6-f complex iron-sulfur subunit
MNRIEFIKNIAAGTITVFVAPVVLTSCEKEPLEPNNVPPEPDNLTIDLTLEANSDLATAGGFIIKDKIIVINTGAGFIALSSVCTHQGCTVAYDHEATNLPCPCHGSVFSTSGSVLNGPAGSPLKEFELQQEGDILTIF